MCLIQKFQFFDQMKDEEWRSHKTDCSIIAIAITCGVSYQEARRKIIDVGKSIKMTGIMKTIKAFGFDYAEVNPKYYLNKLNQLTNQDHKILTKNKAMHNSEIFKDEQNHNQLWVINGHIFACKNGKVEDYEEPKGLNYKIEYIYDIFPAGQNPRKDNHDATQFDRPIKNYDLMLSEFVRLYNEIVKEKYKMDLIAAKEYMSIILNSDEMKDESFYTLYIASHKTTSGAIGELVIDKLSDETISIYY